MNVDVLSPVRVVSDAIGQALSNSLATPVGSHVARSPSEMSAHCRSGALVIVDADVASHANWLDTRAPCADCRVVVFGVSCCARDFCFCDFMGAAGLVGESDPLYELATAVLEVGAGRTYFAPSVSLLIRTMASQHGRQPTLTRREREIADLLTFGGSNPAIAKHLGISVETVPVGGRQLSVRSTSNCCYGFEDCPSGCMGGCGQIGCEDYPDGGCPSGTSCWLSYTCLGECCDCLCDGWDACVCYMGDE